MMIPLSSALLSDESNNRLYYTQRIKRRNKRMASPINNTLRTVVTGILILSTLLSSTAASSIRKRKSRSKITTLDNNNNIININPQQQYRLLEEATILPSSIIQSQLSNSNSTQPSSQSQQLAPSSSLRIINGIETSPTRFSYAASLQFNNEHFCGGALIASDVVITAGHCNGATSLGGLIYDAVIGRHDLGKRNNKNGNVGGESIRIKHEIRHPQYNQESVNNDFNLIFLSEEIQDVTSRTILKVNNDNAIPKNNAPLTVIGYGDTNPANNIVTNSNILLSTTVYSQSNEKCEEASGVVQSQWGPVYTELRGGITSNMLCAWAKDTDACQGDSGGPLIQLGDDESGKDDTLVGIVSWGLGCADDVFPGVYARVSAQYEWIQSNICEYSANPPKWYDCPVKKVGSTPTKKPTMVPKPTSSPVVTPSPTFSPLSDGQRRLLIVLELDDSPYDTGFTLTTLSNDNSDEDSDATELFKVPIGSYDAFVSSNKVHKYEAVVDNEAFYNMTILDRDGNGFEGSLTVYDITNSSSTTTETQLMKEPGFRSGTSVSHGFYVGSSPEQFLTLSFTFDIFAHEVAYEVMNKNDDIIFAISWFQTFTTQDSSAKIVIPIYGTKKGEQTYTLRLWDSGDDGICCLWGFGGYELYLGDPDNDDDDGTLLTSGGEYESKETFQFVIGEETIPPSVSPTPQPSNTPTLEPTLSHPPTLNSTTTSLRPSNYPLTIGLASSSKTLSPTAGRRGTLLPTTAEQGNDIIFQTSSRASDRPASNGEVVLSSSSGLSKEGTVPPVEEYNDATMEDERGESAEYTSSSAVSISSKCARSVVAVFAIISVSLGL